MLFYHMARNYSNNLPFRQKAHCRNLMKTAKAISEKKVFKNNTILYMYITKAQGPQEQILSITKSFNTLIIHCKFQPLVFSTV